MSAALVNRVAAGLRGYWKGAALVAAVIGWAFARTDPDFALSSKLRFWGFLIRVYWPELIMLAAIGAVLFWVGRSSGLHGVAAAATLAAWLRRASSLMVQVSVARVVAGSLALGAALAIVAFPVARQAALVVEAQQTFAAVRLMNWFGDDMHRVGRRLIDTGEYEIAKRAFEVQARELGNDLAEGRSAAAIAQRLDERITERARIARQIDTQIQQSGVTRRHLLLQGVWIAVLPPGPVGAPLSLRPSGVDGLARYRVSLSQLKAACESGRAHTLDARQVGEAASALGFARSADLLFGAVAEVPARADLLCEIAAAHSAEGLQQASRNAFSIRTLPARVDWRGNLPADSLLTPPSWLLRAGARALGAQMYRYTGIDPTRWSGETRSMDGDSDAPVSTPQVPAPESDWLTLLDVPDPQQFDYESFTPVTRDGLYRPDADSVDARLIRVDGEPVLLLCTRRRPGSAPAGMLVRDDPSSRAVRAPSAQCGALAPGEELDGRAASEIAAALLERQERHSRGSSLVPAGAATARSLLCRVLAADPRPLDARQVRQAYQLCPLHAYAAKVPVPDADTAEHE